MGYIHQSYRVIIPPLFRSSSISPSTRLKPSTLRIASMSSASAATPSNDKHDITKWASNDGHFRRQASTFRDVISTGGNFAPEKGRYHLYVRLLTVDQNQARLHGVVDSYNLFFLCRLLCGSSGIVRLPLGASNNHHPQAERSG
jgi:hypothetical protein